MPYMSQHPGLAAEVVIGVADGALGAGAADQPALAVIDLLDGALAAVRDRVVPALGEVGGQSPNSPNPLAKP
jgi:hypothetical protein